MIVTYPSPTDAVLSGALTLLNVHEHGGNNRGEMVELMLSELHQPAGAPWCAAYVRRVGYYALFDPDHGHSTWPLPDTASCQALADFAITEQILSQIPVRGDIFLLRTDSEHEFHHTGFIWSVTDTPAGYRCVTLEGNTTIDESPSTPTSSAQVAIRTRTFLRGGSARFIDWARLITLH